MMASESRRESAELQNQELVRIKEAEAKHQRSSMIRSAFSLMQELVQQQQAAIDELAEAGFPDGSEVEYWVLESEVAFPFDEEGKPQRAYGFLLVPDESIGQKRQGREKLEVFLRAAEASEDDEHIEPSWLEEPTDKTEMVMRHTDSEGTVKSYLLSEEILEPFQHPYHIGRQIRQADLEDTETYYQHFSSRINPRDKKTGELFELFTNWSTSLQRIRIVGSDTVIDFD